LTLIDYLVNIAHVREGGSYLTDRERRRRYQALRALMEAEGCGSCVVVGTPHIGGKRYFRYFTDWPIQSIGGYLLVDAGRAQAVFRASSQAYWAGKVDWVKDIVAVPLPVRHVIEQLRHWPSSGKIGVVGKDYFPVGDYQELEAAVSRDALVDLTSQVDDLQVIKSPEERALMRACGQIFDAAWGRVLERARPGMTECELAACAAEALVQRGVPHHVILIGASTPSFAAQCVGWPRERIVTEEDIVQMSIEGPGPSGYTIEVGGTFSFRPPDDTMVRQFQAQAAGVAAGVERLRPGNTAESVALAVHETFRQHGFESGYWAGHGIGLGLPERPTLERGETTELAAGMAFALHPNAVGADGRGSLLSRTFLVGDEGPEPLSKFPLAWVQL
jgi:Xaa-Pro aminopeptidase